jgi:hypothetical protein
MAALANSAVAQTALAPDAPVATQANPAPDPQAALEQRVVELEAALRELRAELAAQRAATPAPVQTAAAPVPSGPPAPAPVQRADGFRVGDTTIKLSGFVKVDALASSYSDGDTATAAAGRDYYLPSSIPVGGETSDNVDFDIHAKQTRLVLNASTPGGDGAVTTHIEADFQTSPGTQGTERTTNGYNFALRRAFITYGDWMIGQDWSNFMHPAVMPETTDLIGPTEGVVFVRQPMIRWKHALSDRLTLYLAAENPETASITSASAAMVENDDDEGPDLTARLVYAAPYGEFSLAAVARRLSVDGPGLDESAAGWGVSLGGKMPFGRDDRNDLRFLLTHGEGIGRYVGVNFAPDAVLDLTAVDPELETVSVTAAYVAARWWWSDKMRSTVMLSGQDVDLPDGVIPLDANAAAWSLGANLFYTAAPGLDVGLEYRHGERQLASGAEGSLDRLHLIAKQSF